MTDKEAQQDELLALASIYDAEVISTTPEGTLTAGGQFAAHLDLPHPFNVILQPKGEETNLGLTVNFVDGDILAQLEVFVNQSTWHRTGKSELQLKREGGPVEDAGQNAFNVKFLPPVMLFFELPPDYPSKRPPQITLSCKWLTLQQLSKLCRSLDEVWEENKGDVILFTWTSFLKDELLEFLAIQSPLDLTNVVDPRTKHSEPCDTPEPCATETGAAMVRQRDNGAIDAARLSDIAARHDERAIQDIASQSLLLPTILEYDKRQREKDFLGSVFMCQVCFMEKLGSLCMSFAVCNHVYCKECMRGYFEVQITDGNVQSLTCPDTECDSVAHPAQIKDLVSPEQFQRYDRLLLQSLLDEMADIMYCPRKMCACPVMVDTSHGMGSCPACHYSFCIFCKLAYHGVSPCRIKVADAQKLREEYNNADPKHKVEMERRYGRRAMQQIIEESYSSEYLEKEARKCPHCSTWISKIDGCNKMSCTKCHTYFCWLCQGQLPKQNPYGHFNLPGGECFNKLFQGVQMDEDEERFFIPADSDDSDIDDEDIQNLIRVL